MDPDPQGTLTRAIQMLLWKVGGTVDFTERDMVELAAGELPPVDIAMTDNQGSPWRTRIRLRGRPVPGTEADVEIRRMRGD